MDTTSARLPAVIAELLAAIGEDPGQPGLEGTPDRVARSLEFLTAGRHEDPVALLRGALFESDVDEMVVVRGMEFYSLCEHHLLPFFGTCHIAYVPDGRIVGLSKLGRVVDALSRRLQVQEQLTAQVAAAIQEAVAPKGVGVVIEARHLCMMMRGVEKQAAEAVTSCMLGRFRQDPRTRGEFLELIRKKD